MTQETLKRANELTHHIQLATREIEMMQKVDIGVGRCISIYNINNIYAHAELLKQIVDLAVSYKQRQIENWQKELNEL